MDVDLGVRTKSKTPSLQLDYPIRIRIHIDEVKPWPPSPSPRTPGAVVIHWEQMQMQLYGDGTSGFTKQVVPAASDGRIEFNESFGLKVGLRGRGVSASGSHSHSHNNKCIVEFNLYEHDRIRKGRRLLGTAVLDLAALALAYGSVIKEDLRLSLSIPIHCNCKRTSRPNSAQPLLFLKIEASNSTERKKNHGGSVSAENIASFLYRDGEEGREVENEVLKVNDYPPVDIQNRVPLPLGNATSSTGSTTTRKKNRSASASDTSPSNLGRIQQLEHRIMILERELREAAGLEVSLYSVIAEHGSSMNKVHAPARRLSRLYFKHNPSSKSLVSGLISAAKACGNDVPRLTFWLSNTLVLRAIISSRKSQNCLGLGRSMGKGGDKNVNKKWESFPRGESVVHKENLVAFVAALEKAESWIFSRIIESLWWQIFTPRMQTGASIDSNKSKFYKTTSSSIEQQQQQGSFSVELWKKAFRDACERICPVRGGGHDCGCLPLLSKLIMEQVVARLDVAMLNGILRVSADEIPTDPVADPISDANVLPIPAGKASFGAGVRLKNAIGNWSRWLSDLFDMDDENSSSSSSSSSKSPFYLLNALSELMMLPKDMLLTPSIRKQVCPTFGISLLTRILVSFVPDEFYPDPVPVTLVESLNSQNLEEKDSIVNLPCEAAPVVYKAPSVAIVLAVCVTCKLTRSGSSLLNKSQTSDDELDQLDSPLKPITGSPPTSVRYQLLRQIWNDD